MYAGSALIGVAAAAIAIPIFALGQGSPGGGAAVIPNSVAVIDPNSVECLLAAQQTFLTDDTTAASLTSAR